MFANIELYLLGKTFFFIHTNVISELFLVTLVHFQTIRMSCVVTFTLNQQDQLLITTVNITIGKEPLCELLAAIYPDIKSGFQSSAQG